MLKQETTHILTKTNTFTVRLLQLRRRESFQLRARFGFATSDDFILIHFETTGVDFPTAIANGVVTMNGFLDYCSVILLIAFHDVLKRWCASGPLASDSAFDGLSTVLVNAAHDSVRWIAIFSYCTFEDGVVGSVSIAVQ